MLPESARDEEEAANTGRRNEQIAVLLESAEEEAANTGRRNEQRAVLPRDEEEAANTGRRSEQRVLPESARNEEGAQTLASCIRDIPSFICRIEFLRVLVIIISFCYYL